jgi:two-component system sensor histidine kinase DesK
MDASIAQPDGMAVRLGGLAKRYGKVEAVRGIDVDVAAGEVVALLGTGRRRQVHHHRPSARADPPGSSYLLANAAVGWLVALPSIGIVYLAGVLVERVDATAEVLLASGIAAWLAGHPVRVLRLAIGTVTNPASAQPLCWLELLFRSLFGGIAFPIGQMPPVVAGLGPRTAVVLARPARQRPWAAVASTSRSGGPGRLERTARPGGDVPPPVRRRPPAARLVTVRFHLVSGDRPVFLIPAQWRRGWGLLFGGLWLIFLAAPATTALGRHPDLAGRAATIAATAVFGALYMGLFWVSNRPVRQRFAAIVLVGLTAMSVVFCLLAGEEGLFTFVYLATIGALILTPGVSIAWAATLVALTAVLPLAIPGWQFDPAIPFAVGMGALAALGFVQLLRRNQQLTQAREQITRLAVADERLRFARDLHDLLGHSLTIMAVKADLAGKLVVRAPDRARTEITDLEQLAREALTDVRATVAGYRATSLAAEISHARRSLEAAGITADLPLAIDDVPRPRRELFGWVVREGPPTWCGTAGRVPAPCG